MKGIIAAGHELTALAGIEMYEKGGNAFDAALAASFASFVCEPALTSPGGGGFLTAHTKDGVTRIYDFFTNVPGKGASSEKGKADFFPVYIDFADTIQEIYIGRGSASVPGVFAGLDRVHRNHCALDLRTIMAPAIRYAREGIKITPWQAYFNGLLSKMLSMSEESRAIYAPGGRLLKEGETFFNRAIANIFEHLSEEGLEGFYRSEMAEMILEGFGEGSGGLITGEDLDAYCVQERRPLKINYRDRTVYTNPPPSSGGSLIAFSLKLLEGFDVAAMGHNSATYIKLLSSVMRVTNEARGEDFDHRIYEAGVAEDFLSAERIFSYREKVGAGAAPLRGDRGPSLGNTTQISAVDGDGNVASLTTSVGMGCGFMIPGTGIMMNNMLGEKDLNPLGFHSQPPGVRMSSMMSPTIVMRGGRPEVVLGSGGSKRIRSAILQVIVNVIDHALEVREAVNSPRVHWEGGVLDAEKGIDDGVLDALAAEGLKLKRWKKKDMYFGGVHTIVEEGGIFTGSGDLRRGGAVKELSGPD
ncbi:MAG: gamma-glutamyltransferase [Thermodesulfobacteriota bacterium]|nr:MAG: gamma-glutamyltransferase [Thermodesulfobacteriota bacterium]